MNLRYYLLWLWGIGVDHVLPLAAFFVLALLVPRVGRLIIRIIENRLNEDEESTKAHLALLGALVYVGQAVAYFLLIIAALSNLGVPPLGAAIPATIVSAAVGFGAQAIIADFLAGFFVLSEKQYGVGDYVSFTGINGVEGTVVALTLRTTKVRTPTGEVVTVPNGKAGVVTNYSQDWSRAVVDLQVPMQSGDRLEEIAARVERVSAKALADPAIAQDVAGELEILPVTGLVAPMVAGHPWQIKFRVMVTVNPARQWAVERGIRSALVAAFWDHFNAPAERVANLGVPWAPGAPGVAAAESGTFRSRAGSVQQPLPEDDVTVVEKPASDAAEGDDDIDIPPIHDLGAKDHGPGRPSTAASAGADAGEEADPKTEVIAVPGGESTVDVAAKAGDEAVAVAAEEAPRRGTIWRDDHPVGWWNKLWTLGGRVQRSTMRLFAALAAIALVWLLAASPEDGEAGWLSPDRWKTTAPDTPEQPASQPAAEPVVTREPEPAASASAEPTVEETVPESAVPETAAETTTNEPTTEGRAQPAGAPVVPEAPTTRRTRDEWTDEAPTTAEATTAVETASAEPVTEASATP